MTFLSVLKDHTFYIHFTFEITFKKNLHMNVPKIDIYFIEFSAMIVKKFNEKNIFHLTWNFSTCKKHLPIKYLQQWFCPSSYWCNDMVLISLSLALLLKLVYQLHLHLVLKNDLCTCWVLDFYPILAHTSDASNNQVLSGASFKYKKRSNYSTRNLE